MLSISERFGNNVLYAAAIDRISLAEDTTHSVCYLE